MDVLMHRVVNYTPKENFQFLGELLLQEFNEHPIHILLETLFVVFLLYVLFQRRRRRPTQNKPDELTKEEVDQLIAEWKPEPLFPEGELAEPEDNKFVLESAATPHCIVNGKEVLNFAAFNFLGLAGDKEIKEECEKTIRKYGVGSCGPRGFYGTIDVHLDLEKKITNFLGTEETIIYSYAFSTISSAIPAFSKREDLLVVDQGVSFAVQTGVNLSRSEVAYFKHNDMNDLERVLKNAIAAAEKKKKKVLNKRFIVIEGLYTNYGDIVPLQKVVELADKYKFRIVMDDSCGFGVLGKTGRGTCEHFGIPMSAICIYTASMANSMATIGGFCSGSVRVVDHQRLSGLGYCFSASLPPFIATAGNMAIDRLEHNPQMVQKLSDNAEFMHKLLGQGMHEGVRIESAPFSPIYHVRLAAHPALATREKKEKVLQMIVDKAFEKNLCLTRAKYDNKNEKYLPESSIRICVTAGHTKEDITTAVQVLKSAIATVLDKELA